MPSRAANGAFIKSILGERRPHQPIFHSTRTPTGVGVDTKKPPRFEAWGLEVIRRVSPPRSIYTAVDANLISSEEPKSGDKMQVNA